MISPLASWLLVIAIGAIVTLAIALLFPTAEERRHRKNEMTLSEETINRLVAQQRNSYNPAPKRN